MEPVVLVTDVVWVVVVALLYLLGGLVAAGLLVAIPGYVGYVAYQTAAQKELFNPAAFGFTAGFFTLVLLLFVGAAAALLF